MRAPAFIFTQYITKPFKFTINMCKEVPLVVFHLNTIPNTQNIIQNKILDAN